MSRVRCPGTNVRTGGFPGDQDTCPVCYAWVVVNREGRLRKHTTTPEKAKAGSARLDPMTAHDVSDARRTDRRI